MDNKKAVEERAAHLHREGFNCAESVLKAIAEALGMEGEFVPKIATGLGGGVGRSGSICGALTGGVLGLGLKLGRKNPKDNEAKERIYALAHELYNWFKERHGSILCLDLTGCDLSTPEGREKYTRENIREKCHELIVSTVGKVWERIYRKGSGLKN